MINKLNLIKLFVFIGTIFVLSLISPQKISAQCTWSNEVGPDPGINPSQNNCHNTGGGGSSGNVVYSCATYFLEGIWQTGCYSHEFDCPNSLCAGSGTPPPAGGGGSCARPTVNCGPGTTRGTVRQTMYTCAGSRPTGCPALGSAQRYETARHSTAPNRYFLYGCGSCYVDESLPNEPFTSCDWYRVGVYNCVSTTPTCTVDVNPLSIATGTPTIFPASIPASSGVITQVNFTSSNPSVATVTTPDTTASYATTATGIGAGTTTITASVVMSGSVRCTDSAVLTITNTQAWWQVKDGDVKAESNLLMS